MDELYIFTLCFISILVATILFSCFKTCKTLISIKVEPENELHINFTNPCIIKISEDPV
jgi:hypothetical protein